MRSESGGKRAVNHKRIAADLTGRGGSKERRLIELITNSKIMTEKAKALY
jgi:hypothetical protein